MAKQRLKTDDWYQAKRGLRTYHYTNNGIAICHYLTTTNNINKEKSKNYQELS